MRRRALLSATATALAIPLLAGCARDDGSGGGDGGDGDGGSSGGGGGGPYGMVGADGADAAVGGDDAPSASRRTGGPDLGPEPGP